MDEGTRQLVRRIADHVKQAQDERGLSDPVLAERSGVSQEEIKRLKRGKLEPRMDTLYRLAGALAVEPRDLLRGIEWIPDGVGGGRFKLDGEDGQEPCYF